MTPVTVLVTLTPGNKLQAEFSGEHSRQWAGRHEEQTQVLSGRLAERLHFAKLYVGDTSRFVPPEGVLTVLFAALVLACSSEPSSGPIRVLGPWDGAGGSSSAGTGGSAGEHPTAGQSASAGSSAGAQVVAGAGGTVPAGNGGSAGAAGAGGLVQGGTAGAGAVGSSSSGGSGGAGDDCVDQGEPFGYGMCTGVQRYLCNDGTESGYLVDGMRFEPCWSLGSCTGLQAHCGF